MTTTHEIRFEGEVSVPMRDGTRLAADLYRPATGRFPALLERTPYDKRRPVLIEAGRYLAARGYAVVMQDVRGRFGSEGEFRFLSPQEGPDGYDTLEWIVRQQWCDGQVGTMGLSYSTATQQALAVLHPPSLKAQFLLDGGYDYGHRTVRHSGAFEMGVMLPYAYRMARESRELAADPKARAEFEAAWAAVRDWLFTLRGLQGWPPSPLPTAYERWYSTVLRHADDGGYWEQPTVNLAAHVDAYPDIPVFHETSWYGHHVWATTTRYRELRTRLRSPQRLLIGPWLHGHDEFGRSWCGDVDFGGEAVLGALNDLRLRWFDRWLKGSRSGADEEPPVRIFVMGGGSGRRNAEGRLEHGGHWRDEPEWPLARTRWTTLYLHRGGDLRPEPPPAGAAPSTYAFDPRNPVPTIGGNTQTPLLPRLIQGGAFDQRCRSALWVCRGTQALAERPDVLVFQTEPLAEDTEVTGPLTVRLWISSSTPDTDFTAKLIDVHPPSADWPAGFAMNLTDGIVRARSARPQPLRAGEICELTIEPPPVGNLFKAGHRIRLDVSSSNFPHFDANPNTGEPLGGATRLQAALNTVWHDAARPSHVVLPVISEDA
ncbi:MAG TPA: CocE/NonD family hydrolase [Vicinamibacteria bacterium]